MRLVTVFGVALAAVFPAFAAAGQAQTPPVPRSETKPAQSTAPSEQRVPGAHTLLILIKATIISFNQANQTGTYQVFQALGSDRFRAANSPEDLARRFAVFRQRNIDLSPTILLAPQLSRPPTIEAGRLRLVGFFPTTPTRASFDMYFEPSQGRWKLAQFSVTLAPAASTSSRKAPGGR